MQEKKKTDWDMKQVLKITLQNILTVLEYIGIMLVNKAIVICVVFLKVKKEKVIWNG